MCIRDSLCIKPYIGIFLWPPTLNFQLIPVYKEEAKKLEERVQAFDKLKDMEDKVVNLEMELHWALVYEIESVCSHKFL